MHQWLRIAEIIWLIFNEVDAQCDGDDETRNKVYYILAQTCQSLRDPALARLWESIPNLAPVVKCAGRDFWKVENTGNGFKVQIARRISPADIATIRKYGCLVKHFGRPHTQDYKHPNRKTYVTVETWKRLSRAFKGDVLFSNIQSVLIKDDYSMKFARFFFSQNLNTFKLSLPSKWRQTQSQALMLKDFSTHFTNLDSVRLEGYFRGPDSPVAALSNWRSLTRFSSADMSLEMLKTLSHNCSSSLRYLTFDHLSGDIDYARFETDLPKEWYLSLVDVHFPVLEGISISVSHSSDVIRFLEYFPTSTSLRSLMVQTQCPESGWYDLLCTIKNHLHHLTTLDISGNDRWDEEVVSAAPLRLIATDFVTLTQIKIRHLGTLDIGDDDLRMMLQTLPLLEEFTLENRVSRSPNERTITIASLIYFAEYCPSLSFLALEFDARRGKVPQALGPLTKRFSLTQLDVFLSPAKDLPIVAKFLFSIFPAIQQILYEGRAVDGPMPLRFLSYKVPTRWIEILKIYRAHREGRLDI